MRVFYRRIVFFLLVVFILSIAHANSVSAIKITNFLESETKFKIYAANGIFFPRDCPDIPLVSKGTNNSQSYTAVTGNQITWIGDSYSVGAKELIEQKFPGISFGDSVNTATSTIQTSKFVSKNNDSNPSGLDILKSLIEKDELRPYLVFALGTNGGWTQQDVSNFNQIISSVPDTKVVFVTSRIPNDDYASSNAILENLVKTNPNFQLADWTTVYDASYFSSEDNYIHPWVGEGYSKWVDVIYETLRTAGSGNYSIILSAKNANESFFNGTGSRPDITAASWSDTDTESMKRLLTTYGDLAYRLGQVINAPYIAILVQMRYEDSNSRCGKNNFWGNGCPPGTPTGQATRQGDTLGEGFVMYAKTILEYDNGNFYSPVVGISDPKQYLETIGPLWVNGDPHGTGYSSINSMKASVDALTAYIQSPEGSAIVSSFGGTVSNTGTASSSSDSSSSSSSSSSGSTTNISSTTNYNGDAIFSSYEIESIKKNQSVYEEAAAYVKQTKNIDLPWQVIAILHGQENGYSLENPSNGQGIFQFYSLHEAGVNFPDSGEASREEFLRQAKMAAEGFVEGLELGMSNTYKDKLQLSSPTSNDAIMFGFFAYNGRLSGYITQALNLGFSEREAALGAGSPYVVNRIDEKRDPTNAAVAASNTWCQVKSDLGPLECPANNFFGAFVQYLALTGADWSSTSSSSSSTPRTFADFTDNCDISNIMNYDLAVTSQNSVPNGTGASIAEIAIKLADNQNTEGGVDTDFISAAKQVGGGSRSYCGVSPMLDYAMDCGIFVSTVVRYANVDPNFPTPEGGYVHGNCNGKGGTWCLEDYMENSSLWTEITNNQSTENLQPGDIFVINADDYNKNHTFIYVGNSQIAAASLCSHPGELESVYFSESTSAGNIPYRIFRFAGTTTGGGSTGSFDGDLKAIETAYGIRIGAAVSAMGNRDLSSVQVGGSWPGGRAWSTIKVPLAIAAIQQNATTGSVADPYDNNSSCSYSSPSEAARPAITVSSNCAAWWLWQALGGDNSSAASTTQAVIASGGDSSTQVTSDPQGAQGLTSGMTTWNLANQALFAGNLPSLSGASTVLNYMGNQSGSDSTYGLNTLNAMSKGGWGSSNGVNIVRQFGIVNWGNGQCSAVAIGASTNEYAQFSILTEIAQVIRNHQNELPTGSCP